MRQFARFIAFGLVVFFALVLSAIVWSSVFAAERSGRWDAVRDSYLADHPTCAACCASKSLAVHHVLPVHLWPECELEESNLITLCLRCHLLFGHLGDWQAFNPCVRQDAALYLDKLKSRPYYREDRGAFENRFQQAN